MISYVIECSCKYVIGLVIIIGHLAVGFVLVMFLCSLSVWCVKYMYLCNLAYSHNMLVLILIHALKVD